MAHHIGVQNGSFSTAAATAIDGHDLFGSDGPVAERIIRTERQARHRADHLQRTRTKAPARQHRLVRLERERSRPFWHINLEESEPER